MVFLLVSMCFVRCLFLVLFTRRILLEMFENIFLRIKCYLLDKLMIAIFYNEQIHISFSQTHGNVLKNARGIQF